jgi:hypothetical protein
MGYDQSGREFQWFHFFLSASVVLDLGNRSIQGIMGIGKNNGEMRLIS